MKVSLPSRQGQQHACREVRKKMVSAVTSQSMCTLGIYKNFGGIPLIHVYTGHIPLHMIFIVVLYTECFMLTSSLMGLYWEIGEHAFLAFDYNQV